MILTNLDDLRRLHDEARRYGPGSRQWIVFATAMLDSFPHLYDLAKRMNEDTSKIFSAAGSLLSRDDFWSSVEEAGWILPAEIDDLREAIQSYGQEGE